MRTAAVCLFALCIGLTASSYATDLDNNGIAGDEVAIDPGLFEGDTDRTDTVIFPTSQDTWEIYYYPYWWHVGDTVHGDHDVSLTSVNHADVEFYLVYNSLVPDCGFVDLEFQIDGTVVGTLTVWPEDNMGPVNASFDFADMTPPFELRYHETNLVAPGCGSISLDESGMNTVTFSGGPSPAEPPSWAAIKALFR